MESQDRLRRAAEVFREKYGHRWDIVDVSPADRFGSPVIVVTSPSEADRTRIGKELPQVQDGFSVYRIAPMWGIGGLSPDDPETQLWISRILEGPYNEHGTPEQVEYSALGQRILERDEAKWRSMSEREQRAFIAAYIRKRRLSHQEFGNCGDKFLSAS